jgi:hypothetical protein
MSVEKVGKALAEREMDGTRWSSKNDEGCSFGRGAG